jgi:hypothetical protein
MEQEKIDIYANNVSVIASLYDFTLQFSTQTPIDRPQPNQPPRTEVFDICNVRMSPQHAKALATLLVDHTIKYEKQTSSKLALPANLQELWDSLIGR